MTYRDKAVINYLVQQECRRYLSPRHRRTDRRLRYVDADAKAILGGILNGLNIAGHKVKTAAVEKAKDLVSSALKKGAFAKDLVMSAVKKAIESISYKLPGGKDRMVTKYIEGPLSGLKALPAQSVTDSYIRVKVAKMFRDDIREKIAATLRSLAIDAKDLLRKALNGSAGNLIKKALTKAYTSVTDALREIKRKGGIGADKIKSVMASVKNFFTQDPRVIAEAEKMSEFSKFLNAYNAFKNIAPMAQKGLPADPLVTPKRGAGRPRNPDGYYPVG